MTYYRPHFPILSDSDESRGIEELKSTFRVFSSSLGKRIKCVGWEMGSMAAALQAVNIDFEVRDYEEHAVGEGPNVKTTSYVERRPKYSKQTLQESLFMRTWHRLR